MRQNLTKLDTFVCPVGCTYLVVPLYPSLWSQKISKFNINFLSLL